jgi:hypothetical protein
MFEGTLNGAPINELAINETPAEPVYLPETIATIRVDVQGNPQVRGNVFASTAIAGIAITAEGDGTVNPSSEGLSEIRLAGDLQATVSPSSEGVAGVRLSGQASPTINPSSDGVAEIRIDVIGDVTVSGGVDSGGIAKLRVRPRLSPYVWTYLYNEGIGVIRAGGIVSPLARPRIPGIYAQPPPARAMMSPERLAALGVYDESREFEPDRDSREIEVQPERVRE